VCTWGRVRGKSSGMSGPEGSCLDQSRRKARRGSISTFMVTELSANRVSLALFWTTRLDSSSSGMARSISALVWAEFHPSAWSGLRGVAPLPLGSMALVLRRGFLAECWGWDIG